MQTLAAPALTSVARQVRRVISRRTTIQLPRLRRTSHLMRELHFDLLDLVHVILDLESCFHITIPDEVPLLTVGDVVDFVSTETRRSPRS
ncbi:acyl carrier protein [Hymenobacter sp.]|uniref:acyl carrier protein n=1 Tax=Hymenobacter sp. TaxID=1898978 RepID=UPI00286BC44E|nr:acyl carrier protein [Hymenobacter sp.]